jgi:type I restriction enzyme, S subunit
MIYDLLVEYSARPDSWSVVAIDDLADVVGGGTPDTNVPGYWNPPEIPWVTPTDITASADPELLRTERSVSKAGLKNSSATILPIGTTLLTSRATVGECRIAGIPVSTNQGFASLVPKEGTDPDFLFYLAQFAKPAFVRLAAGTTFVEISRREVRRVNVCAPNDPNESKSIGRALRTADAAIGAVKIELEKAQRLKTALLQQLFTKGLPGRHEHFKQTKIGEIPKEWDVRTIRSVLAEPPFSGVSPESRAEPPGTPILNVSCVKNGRCDPGALTYVDVDRATIDECLARKGDFFVLRGNGNREYVATGGLLEVEPPTDCIFSDKLIRLRFNSEMVAGGFVPLMWQWYGFLRRLQSKAESGSGLWMMSKRDIRRELFAYPKIDEQAEIVATVRSAQASIDACKARSDALERLKRSLLQSLLAGTIRLTGARTS